MSAAAIGLLREAARLMRLRASAATPSPWVHDHEGGVRSPNLKAKGGKWVQRTFGGCVVNKPSNPVDPPRIMSNAEHVASWDPSTALLVADLLDEAAVRLEVGGRDPWLGVAIGVASSYLDTPATQRLTG